MLVSTKSKRRERES
jgi:hypothetical protein